MRIEDITGDNDRPNNASTISTSKEKRNALHPEVAELLNARAASMLFNCKALARDEIELANFIINKLDVDPHYAPSETLLQAIRAITDKLGGGSPLNGMIRTA